MMRRFSYLTNSKSNLDLKPTAHIEMANTLLTRRLTWMTVRISSAFIAISHLLHQVIDNVEHPICYFSKRLDCHQQRYSTIEKEALALVLSARNFSVYFGSQPVTVYTDHSPLQFIQRMANYNNKLLRWAIELQQYNFHIVHRPGKQNLIPDILSGPLLNTL